MMQEVKKSIITDKISQSLGLRILHSMLSGTNVAFPKKFIALTQLHHRRNGELCQLAIALFSCYSLCADFLKIGLFVLSNN